MRDFAAELEQSAGRCGGFTMEKPGKIFRQQKLAVWLCCLVNSSEITCPPHQIVSSIGSYGILNSEW